jgi:DNA polymerase-2
VRYGFKVLHGIVDSIWVKKEERENNAISVKGGQQKYYYDDCRELKEAIHRETGFDISFEGIYKWIVFVSSKIKRSICQMVILLAKAPDSGMKA